MHIYPLLVIVAGLLSESPGGVAQTTKSYYICSGSRHNDARITAANSSFNIHMYYYGNNMDCSLVLKSGSQPLVLSFEFRQFLLEDNCFCDFDSLCLNGVLFCSPSFRGKTLYYILPGNRDFTVHFHSDASITMYGFELFVTTSPLAEGQKVDQPVGRGSYLAGTCSVATIYYPDIPYSDGCAQNPPKSTATPSIYRDNNNKISTTTEEAATPTEEAEYDFYYLCNSQQPTVDITTSSSPFLILSPNYGSGRHFDYQFCSLILRSGAQPLVLNMDIKDFYVELCGNCSCDSLCMGGVKFCGDWLTGYKLQFILPEYNHFTITFRTDGSGARRGFKIEVSQELATSEIVQQPSSGNFSSSESLTYTNETFQPGYPYSDRCQRSSFTTP